jgi:glutaredoxin-related protein
MNEDPNLNEESDEF